jgi:hypothetical protein
MPHKDAEVRKAYLRAYHTKNLSENRKKRREWYFKHKSERQEYFKKYKEENKEKVKAWSRGRAQMIRCEVKKYLGGKCVCCGEREPEFLTIDHVRNDAADDRKRFKKTAHDRSISVYVYEEIYRAIRNQLSMERWQLLCFNCNSSKHFGHGVCAHKRRDKKVVVFYAGGEL